MTAPAEPIVDEVVGDFWVPWVFGQAVMVLAQLPDRPRDLADYLAMLHYQGRPKTRGGCALHTYLMGRIDAESSGVTVELDPRSVEVSRGGRSLSWALPEHIGTFLRGFDDGAYPELEEDGCRD